MERTFIIHRHNEENLIIKESEAIQNALDQEKEGITPHYSFFDKGENITNPGWLVWSTYEDGCGVVYRRNDGKMILITGWQGEFNYH
jgi:hypothetical protein